MSEAELFVRGVAPKQMRDNVTVLLLNFVIINCEGLEKNSKNGQKMSQKT